MIWEFAQELHEGSNHIIPLQELGAEPFYKMGEADEVDGLETVADLWKPLQDIVKDSKVMTMPHICLESPGPL